MIAELSAKAKSLAGKSMQRHGFSGIEANTARIVRLRLLMIAAKVVTDSNKDKIRYSVQDNRVHLSTEDPVCIDDEGFRAFDDEIPYDSADLISSTYVNLSFEEDSVKPGKPVVINTTHLFEKAV